MKLTMYRIHKWLAVTVGIFFLVWLISGIVMILPSAKGRRAVKQVQAPVDFLKITVSPADAFKSLRASAQDFSQVRLVELRRIEGKVLYRFVMEAGSSYMIDAQTGRLFTITPETAEKIARGHSPTQADVRSIDVVTRHGFFYPGGPLPAYRIVFDDNRRTVSYVSTRDGTVRQHDRWGRIRSGIASLHTFGPLKLVVKGNSVRKGFLLLFSLLGIAAAGTGYYLALPRRYK